jgi:hypothetical protein
VTRRALLAVLAGAVIDPEKLPWKPGKLISIPKAPSFDFEAEFVRSLLLGQDAIAYSYTEDGHEFWVMHFPSGR